MQAVQLSLRSSEDRDPMAPKKLTVMLVGDEDVVKRVTQTVSKTVPLTTTLLRRALKSKWNTPRSSRRKMT